MWSSAAHLAKSPVSVIARGKLTSAQKVGHGKEKLSEQNRDLACVQANNALRFFRGNQFVTLSLKRQ